jgi:putative membrane protein
MTNMILHLVANAAAILVTALVLPNEVRYDSYTTVAIFAVLLGLLNAVLTPILNAITFPLACLTFGLFRIVVNIIVFLIAVWLVPGNVLEVTPLGAAVGVLVAALASGVLTLVLGEGRG